MALGLALCPVVMGALIRTLKGLSWAEIDWLQLVLIVLASAASMGTALIVLLLVPRSTIARLAKNICFIGLSVLGLALAMGEYRMLITGGSVMDYRTIALMALVFGGVMGIAATVMERRNKIDL